MSDVSTGEHWDGVYLARDPEQVSWFQRDVGVSLRLVGHASGSVVDVGAGASLLVDELVAADRADLTVLDVSSEALEATHRRLGNRADRVTFVQADILDWQPDRTFDCWHDRAVFHFLTDPDQQRKYVEVATRGITPGGALVMGTFATDGPTHCSGLPIARYDADELAARFAGPFTLECAESETHLTPAGTEQRFTWVRLRKASAGQRAAVDRHLDRARAGLDRVQPEGLADEVTAGAIVIDIRPDWQRTRDGELPGAVVVDRNVLEWRLDPTSPHRLPIASDADIRYVLVCNEGYSSSLAAATLHELGLRRATDLVGGFQAWKRPLPEP